MIEIKATYYMPHPYRSTPEGHTTRYNALKSIFPDLHLATSPQELLRDSNLVFIDTLPMGRNNELKNAIPILKYRGTKIVFIARALNEPIAIPDNVYDAIITTGPYEETGGSKNNPIILLGTRGTPIDILLVPSYGQNNYWWLPFQPLNGVQIVSEVPAINLIASADVVIGAGGLTVYEALWSGAKLITIPQSIEQRTRIRSAVAAGESIVEIASVREIEKAIETVRGMKSLGPRDTGLHEIELLAQDIFR
jgi:hypothetical protein